MLKIDSHQHFWQFDSIRDSWITTEMNVIAKDFMPQDLKPLLDEFNFDGCVIVQSDDSLIENTFQLANAKQNNFVKGVVGWVDFNASDLEEQLQEFKKEPLLKGIRHTSLQGNSDRAAFLKPEFKYGMFLLEKYNYAYDLLILEDQLKYVNEFISEIPYLKVVIDHLAKPKIKSGDITDWKIEIDKVASHQNVYCKISGMVTEADWFKAKYEDFEPYLDVAFNAFGVDRLMFGSDWPVCNLAGGYEKMLSVVTTYTSKLSETEQEKFWGGNAQQFYNL